MTGITRVGRGNGADLHALPGQGISISTTPFAPPRGHAGRDPFSHPHPTGPPIFPISSYRTFAARAMSKIKTFGKATYPSCISGLGFSKDMTETDQDQRSGPLPVGAVGHSGWRELTPCCRHLPGGSPFWPAVRPAGVRKGPVQRTVGARQGERCRNRRKTVSYRPYGNVIINGV